MSKGRGPSDQPAPPSAPAGPSSGAEMPDPPAGGEPPAAREIDLWMDELTARLAHDMRAPLGAIRMWSHVLRTGRDSDRPAALDAIDASTAGLGEQMAFLADVTRAVVGRLPLAKQTCDLTSILRHGVDAAASELARRIVHVDLQVALPDDQPLQLQADPARLRRAITCLVTAAGSFIAAERTVLARLTTMDGPGGSRAAVFVVRSPGARIGDGEMEHLFTAYHPGKADLGHPRPDFGLGPVYARSVARLHGGDVFATKEGDENGTLVFTARLPLR